MRYRVITIVYSKRKLSALEIAEQKKYLFVCDYEVKIGDMIESPTYITPCQVVDVTWKDTKPISPRGTVVKTLVVDKINGKPVIGLNNVISKPQKEMKDNSMFKGIVGKYTSQFVPQKEADVRMSMSGLLCVPVDEEYVGIDKENNLVSFPAEMTLPIPVYSINKLNNIVQIGDIVKNGRSYAKVIGKNDDGSLKTLSFTGYTHNKKAVQDFIMGQSTTRVLINMFNFDEQAGFNPIFFAMASGETLDVQSLMMLSMTPQGKNLFSNAGGGFNPMMLWMLDQNKQNNGGGMDMMTMMMMSSAMGGQNPFSQMFGQATPVATPSPYTPVGKPAESAKPTADEALDIVLKNPEALAKLKDALKAE